jgi:hypothetical protein
LTCSSSMASGELLITSDIADLTSMMLPLKFIKN